MMLPRRGDFRALLSSTRVTAVTALLTGCTLFGNDSDWSPGKSPANGKPTQPTGETQLVYSTLQDLYQTDLAKPQATLLVIQETLPVTKHKSMTFPQDYAAMHRYLDTVSKTCVTSFVNANKQRYLLLPLDETPKAIETTTITRINQLFHGGGWQNIQHTFPHAQAMISLARPGTCDHHQEALLYTMATRGDGGGEGVLTHAKLEDGAWHVVKKAIISQADSL